MSNAQNQGYRKVCHPSILARRLCGKITPALPSRENVFLDTRARIGVLHHGERAPGLYEAIVVEFIVHSKKNVPENVSFILISRVGKNSLEATATHIYANTNTESEREVGRKKVSKPPLKNEKKKDGKKNDKK